MFLRLAISPRMRGHNWSISWRHPQPPACRLWRKTEYWFAREEVKKWLDDGVFYLVSPLDSANMTEVELTEEQEIMLNWLDKNQIAHVRVKE